MYSVNDLKFKTPFTMMVAGPSGSGKTYLVRNILKYHSILMQSNNLKIEVIWAYGQWQSLYNQRVDNCNIEYIEGLPSESEIRDKSPNLIVIDDLMNELSDDIKMGNLFTKGSHHMNINVIFITQNLFQ
ncbi:MAG: hypothetical protein QM535_20085, partial [Limnohabitans sp.]|nr:hypothetical protein [Limnohabitans sp.]